MEWVWLISALHLICVVECGLQDVVTYNRSCSYQIPALDSGVPLKQDACLIYNLSGCPSSNVWKNEGSSTGLSFPIRVNLTNYVYARSGVSQSAVNFTFAVTDERVSGFAFRLLEGCAHKVPICRYYDFHQVNKDLVQKTVFFNDDINFPVSYTDRDCNVEIVALSANQDAIGLKRLVFKIPDRATIGNVLNWKSLVSIDLTSYADKGVNIFFTSAPKSFNVSSYVLELYDKTSESPVYCFPVNGTEKVINVRFGDIATGFEYVFKVAQLGDLCDCKSTSACNFAESPLFLPKKFRDVIIEREPMFFIAFVVVLLIAIVIIVVQRHPRPPANLNETTVYLVYSHGVDKHVAVVEALAAYLKTHCFCKVLLDKWDVNNKDPHVWVDDCISSADYVLMIWSEGAFIKMSKKNSKVISCEPGYLGEDLFSLTMFKIKAAIGCELRKPSKQRNLRKFCHISFPYVPRHMVARDLPSLPIFCVPRDLNALLCHLRCVEPAVLCPFNKYPIFAESNLSRTSDGAFLSNAIDSMTQEEYRDLFKNRLEEAASPAAIGISPSHLTENDNHENSETESSANDIDLDVDGGHYGMVDDNFPLNEFCSTSGDNDLMSAYWLPSNAISTSDNQEQYGSSCEPLMDISHIADCSTRLAV